MSTQEMPAMPESTASSRHDNEWYNQDFGDYAISEEPIYTKRAIRVVCVGAGAAGIQLAHKAEKLLEKVTVQIYEKNDDVGGTWLENRYPNCACDVPSHCYQFTWARNPSWSQYYASGREIWQYLKDVATEHGVQKYIKFGHCVQSAAWDDDAGIWRLVIATPDGTMTDQCEMLVNASGVFNKYKYPDIPGLADFQGKLMHTAAWDEQYDLAGKTVAVIGGGSSAVQVIPGIQPQVKKLIPFLRSPAWVTMGFGAKYGGPGGTNFTYSAEQIASFRQDPEAYAQYCRDVDGELNKRFPMNHTDSREQKEACAVLGRRMAAQLPGDGRLADHLVPAFPLGCRRVTPGFGYLESLGAPNVEVVTAAAARLTADGIVDAASGREHKVDAVVCATGFDTSFVPPFACIGKGGQHLRDKFGGVARGYLSVMVDDFPNLFFMIGPNGPASHSSLLPVLEWHTRYLFQLIDKLQRENIQSLAPKAACVEAFGQHTHTLMRRLAWSAPCRSWFKDGRRHGPVTAIWPGSRLHYFEALAAPRYEDFEIVYRSRNRFQYLGNGFTHEELKPDGNLSWYYDDAFCQV